MRQRAWMGLLLALALPGAVGAAAPSALQGGCLDAHVWATHRAATGGLASKWISTSCADAGTAADTVTVDPSARKQRMLGFGAALTGSAAWLLQARVDPARRTEWLRKLFAPPPEGIGLSLLRLPIGSTDLSRRRYSLAPKPPGRTDGKLELDLAPMRDTVLPVLRQVLRIRPRLRIIASPWSPPGWMKTSGNLIGGSLLPMHEMDFARYLVAFVEAMRQLQVPIFALTIQNEPSYVPDNYPGMSMPESQRVRIVADDLGPALVRSGLHTRIFDLDDNWDQVVPALQVLQYPGAAAYVAGVAWHCYRGFPDAQDQIHQAYPGKWQLVTECSDGGKPALDHEESIADFAQRALIGPTRHWSSGTLLWSLALDTPHGPHDGGCSECLGVVTVDRLSGKIEPSRDYYVLAHFSKFVSPGDYRVASSGRADHIDNVAFIDPHTQQVTVVLANRNTESKRVRLLVGKRHLAFELPPRGLATVQTDIGIEAAP